MHFHVYTLTPLKKSTLSDEIGSLGHGHIMAQEVPCQMLVHSPVNLTLDLVVIGTKFI